MVTGGGGDVLFDVSGGGGDVLFDVSGGGGDVTVLCDVRAGRRIGKMGGGVTVTVSVACNGGAEAIGHGPNDVVP